MDVNYYRVPTGIRRAVFIQTLPDGIITSCVTIFFINSFVNVPNLVEFFPFEDSLSV